MSRLKYNRDLYSLRTSETVYYARVPSRLARRTLLLLVSLFEPHERARGSWATFGRTPSEPVVHAPRLTSLCSAKFSDRHRLDARHVVIWERSFRSKPTDLFQSLACTCNCQKAGSSVTKLSARDQQTSNQADRLFRHDVSSHDPGSRVFPVQRNLESSEQGLPM